MDPIVVPRAEHPISRRDIDPDALKVLYRLKQAGHVAYLVGGGVRDLLLGRRPKDFDISTSAHPGEVKRLFRNCRLIGRRFRLAHILFGGGKVIEVATFRRKSEEEPSHEEDLLVRRENTFGTPEEDAERRDFTVNGLFYDIATFSVIDYVGGLADLKAQVVHTIGDPGVRLREDPVRMLRAVKFAARLGFTIGAEDAAAIRTHGNDLLRAAPERLLLELGRLLGGGTASAAIALLDELELLNVALPEVAEYLARHRQLPGPEDLLRKDLAGLDQLVSASREEGDAKELATAVLLATVLAPVLFEPALAGVKTAPEERRGLGFAAGLGDAARREPGGDPGFVALLRQSEAALAPAIGRLAIPGREAERLVQAVAAQPLLRGGSLRAERLLSRRPNLADAVTVLEAHVLGSGGARSDVGRWRDLASRAPQEAPRRGRSRDAGGRRGRRRQRGKGGDDLAPPPADRSALETLDEDSVRQRAEAEQRRRQAANERPRYLPSRIDVLRESLGEQPWNEPGAASPASPATPGRRRRRRRRRGGPPSEPAD